MLCELLSAGTPTGGGYDGSITISTPNTSSVVNARLIKWPDYTHHHDSNMKLFWIGVISCIQISLFDALD